MKKIFFNKWIIIIELVIAISIFYIYNKLGKYNLKPDEDKQITIKGNTQSLDASIEMQIISHNANGKIKLSYGDNWYNKNTDIHYNIATAQIEKWNYDSTLGKSKVTILENPLDGIEVNNEGIILNLPKDVIFSFSSKKDFTIKLENLSDKNVSIEVIVTYR